MLCHCLSVSRSGYYAWLVRKPSQRVQANQRLDEQIRTLFDAHHHRYGAPRITQALKANNEPCSHTRVARRMKHMGLKAMGKKKFKMTTDSEHALPIFDNVLNRDFTTTAINQKGCTDLTYVHTQEGWLY